MYFGMESATGFNGDPLEAGDPLRAAGEIGEARVDDFRSGGNGYAAFDGMVAGKHGADGEHEGNDDGQK